MIPLQKNGPQRSGAHLHPWLATRLADMPRTQQQPGRPTLVCRADFSLKIKFSPNLLKS